MGTRGMIGFIYQGQEKLTYNHFDSYPSGLGVQMLGWARSVTDWERIRGQVASLRLINEQDTPSAAEVAAFADHLDPKVSTGTDWYALLRDLQGDLAGYLNAGVLPDSHGFALDSLFCEWAYIIDLDAGTFDVYRGFQKSLPKAGRWAGRPTAAEDVETYEAHVKWCAENGREPWQREVSEYKAIQMVATWPLHELPDDAGVLVLENYEDEDE